MRFQIDWASLIAAIALFYIVFEGNVSSTSSRGGLYLEGVYIKGLIFGMNCTVSAVPWLIEGSDYEARQTSKEQTKMLRFMLEGPRLCTIFCFAFIHYA